MSIKEKTYAYFVEKYTGAFASIVVFVIIFIIEPSYSSWDGFISEFPTIGMCAFGFLLTFLSIILQGSSETIIWMKKNSTLFSRFVSYNKRIVIVSLILVVFSYVLSYFDFKIVLDFISFTEENILIIKNVCVSLFCALFVWFLIDIFTFIKLFYLLIKKP